MGYKYYIFDLDGVLVDVNYSYKKDIMEEVGKKLDYNFTEDEIKKIWYGIGDFRNSILKSWNIDPEKFWHIFDSLDSPKRRLKNTFTYPDTYIIPKLQVSNMGIVTHSNYRVAKKALEKSNIEKYFRNIISCNKKIGYKPDPSPIKKCMDLIDAKKKDTILIGDSVSDTQAARNAGIDSCHVNRFQDSLDANITVKSLYELANLNERTAS